MTPQEFVTAFELKGGTLWRDGGKLRYGGPQSLITGKIKTYIDRNRERLLLVLDPFGFCGGCEGEAVWRWTGCDEPICMKCCPPNGLPADQVTMPGLFQEAG